MITSSDAPEDDFNEIEVFDAFMDVVNKHQSKSKPSEIENYINDCKTFFRAIYNVGMMDGFELFLKANENIKNLNNGNR